MYLELHVYCLSPLSVGRTILLHFRLSEEESSFITGFSYSLSLLSAVQLSFPLPFSFSLGSFSSSPLPLSIGFGSGIGKPAWLCGEYVFLSGIKTTEATHISICIIDISFCRSTEGGKGKETSRDSRSIHDSWLLAYRSRESEKKPRTEDSPEQKKWNKLPLMLWLTSKKRGPDKRSVTPSSCYVYLYLVRRVSGRSGNGGRGRG